MDRLTRLAGVRATSTEVDPGDAALVRITGARTPSGVPVAEPPKPAPTPRRRPAGPGRPRSGQQRSGQQRSRRAA